MKLILIAAVAFLCGQLPYCVVEAHGNMVMPPTWFDQNGAKSMKAYQQCAQQPGDLTSFCMWFTNETHNTGATIFNKTLLTYDVDNPHGSQFINNPWRAPGSAKTYSPCGVAGGNPEGCPAGDPTKQNCPGGGFSYGPDAIGYNFTNVLTTEWKAGSVVEAAWGIKANHGGGYAYRLCKLPASGDLKKALTEACFNAGHLKFFGDMQWVQHGENKANRTGFKANRTNVGTYPAGSWWTKDPIPACAGAGGGAYSKKCLMGTQFPPPAPGLKGFGEVSPTWQTEFDFSIVDQLMVPEDLTPGKYVLSFRWDCEQTPQVWSACANINIVA